MKAEQRSKQFGAKRAEVAEHSKLVISTQNIYNDILTESSARLSVKQDARAARAEAKTDHEKAVPTKQNYVKNVVNFTAPQPARPKPRRSEAPGRGLDEGFLRKLEKILDRFQKLCRANSSIAYRRIASVNEEFHFHRFRKLKAGFNRIGSILDRNYFYIGEAFRIIRKMKDSKERRQISRIMFLLSKKFNKQIDENFLNEQIRCLILRHKITDQNLLSVVSDNNIQISLDEFHMQGKISKMEKLVKIYCSLELFYPLDLSFHKLKDMYNRHFMRNLIQCIELRKRKMLTDRFASLQALFARKRHEAGQEAFAAIRRRKQRRAKHFSMIINHLVKSKVIRQKQFAYSRLMLRLSPSQTLPHLLAQLFRLQKTRAFFKMFYSRTPEWGSFAFRSQHCLSLSPLDHEFAHPPLRENFELEPEPEPAADERSEYSSKYCSSVSSSEKFSNVDLKNKPNKYAQQSKREDCNASANLRSVHYDSSSNYFRTHHQLGQAQDPQPAPFLPKKAVDLEAKNLLDSLSSQKQTKIETKLPAGQDGGRASVAAQARASNSYPEGLPAYEENQNLQRQSKISQKRKKYLVAAPGGNGATMETFENNLPNMMSIIPNRMSSALNSLDFKYLSNINLSNQDFIQRRSIAPSFVSADQANHFLKTLRRTLLKKPFSLIARESTRKENYTYKLRSLVHTLESFIKAKNLLLKSLGFSAVKSWRPKKVNSYDAFCRKLVGIFKRRTAERCQLLWNYY